MINELLTKDIRKEINTKQDKIIDTGWVDLPLASGVTAFHHRVRKIGNVVYLQLEQIEKWTFNKPFTTIPDGFRPPITQNIRVLVAGVGDTHGRLEILPNGNISVYNGTITQGTFVDYYITWVLD